MDKQRFTRGLVQCATTGTTTDVTFIGHPGFSFKNGSFIIVLSLKATYIYCPCVPQLDVFERDYGKSWNDFWKRVHEEYCKNEDYQCKFSGKDRTYNWNGGKTAIVIGDKMYVCRSESVDYATLKELGFTLDYSLFVPMSNGEAYYEPAADYGTNNCGLINLG